MYLCYQNLPGIFKPLILSKLFIHRPASTWITPRQAWSQLLYRFYWKFPYPVYRCCSCTALLVSTKRTAALPWRAIQVHTQNVLSKCTLRTCYPSAHSERAIQVHTQNVLSKCTFRTCYPSAHSERAIQEHTQNVLSKCTLRTCHPSAHSEGAIQVHIQNVLSKCTLRTCYEVHGIRVHHSRTLMHHWHTHNRYC